MQSHEFPMVISNFYCKTMNVSYWELILISPSGQVHNCIKAFALHNNMMIAVYLNDKMACHYSSFSYRKHE